MAETISIESYDPPVIKYDEGQVATKFELVFPAEELVVPTTGLLAIIDHLKVSAPCRPRFTLCFSEPASIDYVVKSLRNQEGMVLYKAMAKKQIEILQEGISNLDESILASLTLGAIARSLQC